jgi:hypothetical protein
VKILAVILALVTFASVLGCATTPRGSTDLGQAEAAGLPVECGAPCVITNSPGGVIMDFRLEGFILLHAHVPIIVDGPCFSACTLLLDVAHNEVCLTTRALLGYHQARLVDKTGKIERFTMLNYETPGLNAYFVSRGGLPASTDMLIVPFDEATKFYPPCVGAK